MVDGDGSKCQWVQSLGNGLLLFGGGGWRTGFAYFLESKLGQLLSPYHQYIMQIREGA